MKKIQEFVRAKTQEDIFGKIYLTWDEEKHKRGHSDKIKRRINNVNRIIHT